MAFLPALFIFLLFSVSATDVNKLNSETSYLISFKQSLQNPSALAFWNVSYSHCDWIGVTCRFGRVYSLSLPSTSLKGYLFPSLFYLRSLSVLDLSKNSLFGQIPKEISRLENLQQLKLNFNFFSGEIPPELGRLKQLQTLDLSRNSLTGLIPSQLGELTQLLYLDVSGNNLSGSLPPSLFLSFSALSSLDVSNNSLSGEVPPEIGKLSNLSDLYMGLNSFSGQLPPEIGNISLLKNFVAPSCFFKGPLPKEISKLRNLAKLDLSNNPLKCSIPKSFGKLQKLTILNLVSAELIGLIPLELSHCKSLKTLMLSFNDLSGSLPLELSEIPLLTFSAENNKFSGSLPSWIGKWKQLDSLLLANNKFSGEIPHGIKDCSMLKHLNLANNLLTGLIPPELCGSGALEDIDLSGNYLTGNIDDDVFIGCTNLMQLVLTKNQIHGLIPEYFSKLPLMVLDLDSNNFTGEIPTSLWNSTNLMEFSASYNRLQGYLPVEIGFASSLKRLVLTNNQIRGEIPREIRNLTLLSVLNLNSNKLQGKIPNELGDCTSLTTLDLGNNNLQGQIPERITALSQLQSLVFSYNNLSGSIPSKPSTYFHQTEMPDLSFLQHHGKFDLSYNNLTGHIPSELGDCVVVVELLLSHNHLSGEIPSSLSRLTNLTILDLSENAFTGSIPEKMGHSPKLQGLNLANNQLSGLIPESFGLLCRLVKLNLTKNKLYGSVPASLGNLKELTHMDLSFNKLNGELPPEISQMLKLVGLYIEHNMFTGEIPADIGNLTQLEYINASENMLSGYIPTKVCGLPNLQFLNLAMNNLQGDVPSDGVCQDPSKALLSGNKGLCGKVIGSDCKVNELKLLNAWGLARFILGSTIIVLVSVFSLRVWIMMRKRPKQRGNAEGMKENRIKGFVDQSLYFLGGSRSKEPLSINVAMFEQPLVKVSLEDIVEATDHFDKKNIIGDGGFGTVYKACLSSGKTVAVKKLNEAKTQGSREFMAEMETLGKVKHPNLVSLLGYCSFSEEKLLVYEYMVNGSLDHWLRNQTGILEVLDWSKRLKIALGAARGLAFLHHGFIPHIIHRDIKSSNILIDSEFEPKIADFGLARLISACETHVSTVIAGTFGYIPPEYGQSARATTKGDVYSFGVILLELVTGKEPTGPDFKESEGGNLVGWVVQKINKGKAVDVLDPLVYSEVLKHSMLRLLQIAMLCLSETPANRPTMLDVLKDLKEI